MALITPESFLHDLQKYLSTFQHNLNLERFLALSEQMLRSINIMKRSHRIVLIIYVKYIKRLFNYHNEIGQHLTWIIKNYTDTDYLLTIKEVMEEAPNNNHVIGSHVNGDIKSITINSCNSLQTTSTQRQESNDDIILTLDIKYGKDNELPSYLEVIKHEPGLTVTTCESCETLPAYSCSVFKAGYVLKKDEMVSHGVRAKRRTWKKVYLCLWGTLLRIYKSEPLDTNCVAPIREFSMNRAEIGLAVDYTKRFHVLRVYVATGHQFLFQTTNRDDSISWIENFQSSVNISSSIDDQEMPMFITLPARFQRNVNTLPFVPSTNTRNRDYNELGRSNLSNRNSSFIEII